MNSSAEELIVTEIISPHKISKELPTAGPATGEKLGVVSAMFPQVWPEEDRQNRVEFTDRRLTVDATDRSSCHRKMRWKQVERVPAIPIKLLGLRPRKAA